MSSDALTEVRRELRERLLERVDAPGLAASSRAERRVRVREEALDVLRSSGVILARIKTLLGDSTVQRIEIRTRS